MLGLGETRINGLGQPAQSRNETPCHSRYDPSRKDNTYHHELLKRAKPREKALRALILFAKGRSFSARELPKPVFVPHDTNNGRK